jgi:hypothetical protein
MRRPVNQDACDGGGEWGAGTEKERAYPVKGMGDLGTEEITDADINDWSGD